jgi:hypothetical protein
MPSKASQQSASQQSGHSNIFIYFHLLQCFLRDYLTVDNYKCTFCVYILPYPEITSLPSYLKSGNNLSTLKEVYLIFSKSI